MSQKVELFRNNRKFVKTKSNKKSKVGKGKRWLKAGSK
jgi:hypothetical protein